jgi:hypothetical protein
MTPYKAALPGCPQIVVKKYPRFVCIRISKGVLLIHRMNKQKIGPKQYLLTSLCGLTIKPVFIYLCELDFVFRFNKTCGDTRRNTMYCKKLLLVIVALMMFSINAYPITKNEGLKKEIYVINGIMVFDYTKAAISLSQISYIRHNKKERKIQIYFITDYKAPFFAEYDNSDFKTNTLSEVYDHILTEWIAYKGKSD